MSSLLENSLVDNRALALDNGSKQQSMHGLIDRIHPLSTSGSVMFSLSRTQCIELDPRVNHRSNGGTLPIKRGTGSQRSKSSQREVSVMMKEQQRQEQDGSRCQRLIVKPS